MTVFVCSFLYVGAKAFQQLSVAHDRRVWIIPVSLLMAVMECKIIASIVLEPSLWTALPLGLGAGCGCLLAMELHKRMRR